jgi:hypothetical protein
MGRAVRVVAPSALFNGYRWSAPMSQTFEASKSFIALEQDSLKKLDADEHAVLKFLDRWRKEAGQSGRQIKGIVVAHGPISKGFGCRTWTTEPSGQWSASESRQGRNPLLWKGRALCYWALVEAG